MSDAVKLIPDFDDLNNSETIIQHIEELKRFTKISSPSDWLHSCEVKVTDQILKPQVAWLQCDTNNEEAILGTLGNFSLIIGKAKSRKSFFINIAVSAVLGNDLLLNQFKGALNPENNNVLYFDTEQGRYHVQTALKRICKQINVDEPKNLKVYGLRSFNPNERLKIIEYAIENTPNLGFVVIDGIKDLVTSINDEEQATMIASKLLKWTEEKNIHILTVLHQNKSDSNARGHIGTELINKAETVLSVTKSDNDKSISIVEAQQCRNKEPEAFAFEINNDGIPVFVNNFHWSNKNAKVFDVTDLNFGNKNEILDEIYKHGENFRYGDLVVQVKLSFGKVLDKSIGDNKAKSFISSCKNDNLISKTAPYRRIE